jgi:hypothetical protein
MLFGIKQHKNQNQGLFHVVSLPYPQSISACSGFQLGIYQAWRQTWRDYDPTSIGMWPEFLVDVNSQTKKYGTISLVTTQVGGAWWQLAEIDHEWSWHLWYLTC